MAEETQEGNRIIEGFGTTPSLAMKNLEHVAIEQGIETPLPNIETRQMECGDEYIATAQY